MLETLLKIDFLNLCIEKLPKTARNSQNLWWRRKILNHTATQAWALSSKTGSFFLFFTFENGYFPNEILKNKTLCRTFLYRLKSYEAAAASANVYINTMRHFNQKRSHSIQKTMLEWTLSCKSCQPNNAMK